MRLLARNKTQVTYKLYLGNVEVMDADGNFTGEKPPQYSEPVTIDAYVTAARGTADLDLFGVNTPYTHSVYTEDIECPIDENSSLEIFGMPFAVTAVARSLNHITYAVRQLTEPGELK